jgi:hypothetical protein
MRKLIWLLFFITLTQVGCAPKVLVTKFALLPSLHKTGNIDVYTSHESIKKPYKEIALITVDDEGYGRSESELLEKLISKAKEIGADGVIILSQDKQSEGGVFIDGFFLSLSSRIVRGTAIVYEKNE